MTPYTYRVQFSAFAWADIAEALSDDDNLHVAQFLEAVELIQAHARLNDQPDGCVLMGAGTISAKVFVDYADGLDA